MKTVKTYKGLNTLKIMTLSTTTLLSLTACDTIKSSLNYSADEFNVSSNPPLSLPPCYDLEPPVSGSKDNALQQPKESQEEKKGKTLLIGKTTKTSGKKSKANSDIIKKAKKDEAVETNIREVVNTEADKAQENGSLGEKLSSIGQKIAENAANTSNDNMKATSTSTTEESKK